MVNGYTSQKEDHLVRLRRIEGQVRGIAKMVEEDKYCIDILTQVSAASRALQSFALGRPEGHRPPCRGEAARGAGEGRRRSRKEPPTPLPRRFAADRTRALRAGRRAGPGAGAG